MQEPFAVREIHRLLEIFCELITLSEQEQVSFDELLLSANEQDITAIQKI